MSGLGLGLTAQNSSTVFFQKLQKNTTQCEMSYQGYFISVLCAFKMVWSTSSITEVFLSDIMNLTCSSGQDLLLSHCTEFPEDGTGEKEIETHIRRQTCTPQTETWYRTKGIKRLNNLQLLQDFDLISSHSYLAKSLLYSQVKWHSGISNPRLQECLLSLTEFAWLGYHWPEITPWNWFFFVVYLYMIQNISIVLILGPNNWHTVKYGEREWVYNSFLRTNVYKLIPTDDD